MIKLAFVALLSLVSATDAVQTDTAQVAPVATAEAEQVKIAQDDDDEYEYIDDTTPAPGPSGILAFAGLDSAAAKQAMSDFFNDLNDQARQFTRNITPSMEMFAQRMESAGFPSPLIHGFREIKVPDNSILPSFVPNIPSMGPFNPATWSQEQIDAALNPPPLFNGLLNPNTVTEIPGIGRFSLAIPPVMVETPMSSWMPGGGMPSFIKYERIPGEAPSYLNFPELGLLNPANAYAGHRPATGNGPIVNAINHSPLGPSMNHLQNMYAHATGLDTPQSDNRQLSVAGDLLQNSFDRLTDIVSGAGGGGAGILGQNVIDPVLNLVRRPDQGSNNGGILSNLLDRTQRLVQQTS